MPVLGLPVAERQKAVDLGWSQTAMTKEAGISPAIAKRAEQLLPIQARTARALADALSKAYERERNQAQ